MARRIKKADIKFISLVPRGANKLEAVYKSDGEFEMGTLSKFDEEGELTAVVYAPNLRDSQGDIADEAVVKQMAHDFIANGASIDIRHDGKPVGTDRARVAESFIVQKNDERFQGWKDTDGSAVDLTGAWATVIKIDDEQLREKFRSGEWAGVSMGGTAIVEQEKADIENLIEALSKAINRPAHSNNPDQEDSMTPEQFADLQKSMAEGFKAMGENLVEALKPQQKPAEEKKPVEKSAPQFKGKLSDHTAVRKHALEVQLHNLESSLDWDNQESVDEFLAKSESIAQSIADLDKEQAEVKGKARAGAADQNASKSTVEDIHVAGITKEDNDHLQVGIALADALNKQHGLTKE